MPDLRKRPGAEVEPAVLDAELVDDAADKSTPAPQRPIVRRPVYVITTLGSSSTAAKALRAGQAGLRHAWIVAQGGVSWARQAHGAATHGYLREQVKVARAAGDRESLKIWLDALENARDGRTKRLVLLPQVVRGILTMFGALLAGLLLLLVAIGLAIQLAPGGDTWSTWWGAVGDVLDLAGAVISWAVRIFTWAALPLLILLAWRTGKRVGDPPVWLLTAAQRAHQAATITPSRVVVAFRDIGISELRKALKDMPDNGATMVSPIKDAGRGVEFDFSLPSGVSTADVLAKKPLQRLAENLGRHLHEVQVNVAPVARTVRVWAAESGSLDEPVGPSPLVLDTAPAADFYTGRAPWGESLRGDPVELSLLQCHLLITGLSKQGKTASARALLLWLIFDVTAEVHLADLKGLGDWHGFAPVAQTLIEGPADEHVIAATEMLEWGVEEMERRMQALDKDKYPNGVTRQLARERGSGFHPVFLIVDEGQIGFMSPALDERKQPYGGRKATSRFMNAIRRIENQGRAVNVMVWLFTQDPTNENLPKIIREAMHIRCSLVVGTEQQSGMALGDAAVAKGAAPHLLRQGIDKGVLVITGEGVPLPPGQASITVRTHFIDGDAANQIIARAVELRRKANRLPTREAIEPTPEPDRLADLLEALHGELRARTTVVLGRLREYDPDFYMPMSAQSFRAHLDELGIPRRKSDGDSVVRLEDVQETLERQATEMIRSSLDEVPAGQPREDDQ